MSSPYFKKKSLSNIPLATSLVSAMYMRIFLLAGGQCRRALCKADDVDTPHVSTPFSLSQITIITNNLSCITQSKRKGASGLT
jgi:hypothetical protein